VGAALHPGLDFEYQRAPTIITVHEKNSSQSWQVQASLKAVCPSVRPLNDRTDATASGKIAASHGDLSRNLLFDFKYGTDFTPIPPDRDIDMDAHLSDT